MKNKLILTILMSLFLAFIVSAQDVLVLEIPANDKIELDYPAYESYMATINNKSMRDLEVKVLDKLTDEQVSGFGLGLKGKEEIMVKGTSKLTIINNNEISARVKIQIVEKDMKAKEPKRTYVSFTLANKSAEGIPLIIPTVMNPNLSPFSESGVDLKIGQEIIFRKNGRKYVLLTVDDSIQNGAVLDVAKLLKEKKEELGLKS